MLAVHVPLRQTVRDYATLMKPRIVLLLIFTTVTAMIVARRDVPALTLVSTIIGGTLSAAGASALNHYLDRDIDVHMSRTKNRPIPGGRIQPVNALLFGLGLLAWSTLILATLVNPLAAGLSLLGAFYYLGIYTLLLKRTSPLNIVIGGGAGAIPVLVGWAAATGTLSSGAFLLFALVFFWTPPHSWALAVLVNADYERAHIPMMSVAHGSEVTRLQIVWYSLQLVVLTLLPLPLRMLGVFYFAAAVLLGAGLLGKSLLLMRDATKAAARSMYKYSSFYLSLLFLAMILDRLLF
jgi:protoheme IX farnesyltransferase